MTTTDKPRAGQEPAFEPRGAGLGVWVFTSFIAVLALAMSVIALVLSLTHQTKKVVTAAAPAAALAAPKAPAGVPTVHLSEYRVDAGTSTVGPGKVNFTIANGGRTEHELLVFRTDTPPASFPLDPQGDINEAALNKISDGDNIAPGATQARTVDLSQPGTYVFVCNLPGHFKAGMYQVVTVQ